MPPYTRLRACCSANSENLAYCRVTLALPAVPIQVTENGISSLPNARSSARAALVPTQVMLLECEGYGGVFSSGVHVASAVVAAFRSSSARRMAVTGLHRP